MDRLGQIREKIARQSIAVVLTKEDAEFLLYLIEKEASLVEAAVRIISETEGLTERQRNLLKDAEGLMARLQGN